ncbi:MAG TPA: PQQ-binding-like beta-propeller repeat protein [Anaerolineaceae bacterium]|nr:PQQ-binding-like beta-propeller repeat protein [Anaerolineaceae bacterium]
MKKKILILIMFSILALSLTACTGMMNASGWPGISGDEDSVYVAYANQVYSLRLRDGSMNWRYPEKAEGARTFFANPAVNGSSVIVGDYKNSLTALDTQSGTIKWIFEGAKNRYIGGALVVGDTVLAPNADHNLYALDLNGNLKWTFTSRHSLWSTPIVNEDVVYLSSMDHYLYAIDIRSGSLIWEVDLGGAIVYSPSFDTDTIFVATLANEVIAIDAKNGSTKWNVLAEAGLWSQPIYHDGVVYYGDRVGKIFAVSAINGNVIWDYQMGEMVSGAPVVMENGVVFAGENGKLVALDFNGNILWTRSITGKLYTGPVIVDGLLVLGISQGSEVLKAYDFNGNEIWKFTPEK